MTTVSFLLLLFTSQDPSRVPGQRCTSSGNDLWPSLTPLLLYFTVEGEDDPGSRFLNQGTAGDCLSIPLSLIYRSASTISDPLALCHQGYTSRSDGAVYFTYSEKVF